jgi:hypothetical protein
LRDDASYAGSFGGQELRGSEMIRFRPAAIGFILSVDCSGPRVERSVARDPVHPSAATTNAALAGDLHEVPLGTPKEAPALLQTRFYIIDEQSPKTNDPHGQRPKSERNHLCILRALCEFKTEEFPSRRCSSAAARAPASADQEWITRDFSQVKRKPAPRCEGNPLTAIGGRGVRIARLPALSERRRAADNDSAGIPCCRTLLPRKLTCWQRTTEATLRAYFPQIRILSPNRPNAAMRDRTLGRRIEGG